MTNNDNIEVKCPDCKSEEIRRHGFLRRKKVPIRQIYQCKVCSRQFTLEQYSNPGPKPEPLTSATNKKRLKATWKQRSFRSRPDLDPYIDADPESFQVIVDRYLRRRYKIS